MDTYTKKGILLRKNLWILRRAEFTQHVQDKTFNCRLKDRGMLSNRISTLHKDLFMLLSKIQAGKYRWKCGINILKVRPENRTAGDKQYNDISNRQYNDISALADWDQTQWFLMQQCLCPTFCLCRFSLHIYAEGTHYTVEGKLVSSVPEQEPNRLGEVPK